jgi:hypothetical protein
MESIPLVELFNRTQLRLTNQGADILTNKLRGVSWVQDRKVMYQWAVEVFGDTFVSTMNISAMSVLNQIWTMIGEAQRIDIRAKVEDGEEEHCLIRLVDSAACLTDHYDSSEAAIPFVALGNEMRKLLGLPLKALNDLEG